MVFDVWVGGGLGSKERFADRLGVHISPHEVVEVTHHICAIFRDHGNRRLAGTRSFLKFLWANGGPSASAASWKKELGRKLTDGDARRFRRATTARTSASTRNARTGYNVGAATTRGEIPGTAMLALAEHGQEITRRSRPSDDDTEPCRARRAGEKCETLAAKLAELALYVPLRPSERDAGLTGKRFCKLAVTETKGGPRKSSRTSNKNFPAVDGLFASA